MGKLLVAVDGSQPAKRAVKFTVDLAKKFSSKVYVLHVIDLEFAQELRLPEFSFFQNPRDDLLQSRKENKYVDMVCEQLLDSAEDELKSSGIKVETICASGNPADQILDTARKFKVDAIVMGNRGRGLFSRATMGSVSSKVCNHAENACVIVK